MKATKTNLGAIRAHVLNVNARSAWAKGVQAYALDLLEVFDEIREYCADNGEELPNMDEVTALNGASSWEHWSAGGCGLVSRNSIVARLCTPSEAKRLPVSFDEIETEARAARQAWQLIKSAMWMIQQEQPRTAEVSNAANVA